jgi:hypothetical protein
VACVLSMRLSMSMSVSSSLRLFGDVVLPKGCETAEEGEVCGAWFEIV